MNRADYSYSVVIPLFKSEATIERVVDEVLNEFQRLELDRYEILLVNDGSPDNVLSVAVSLIEKDPNIIVIDLAKNSGQGNAIRAGLEHATGDYIITMDDDMQHPGYEVGTLIDAIIDRDDDVVFASFDESGNKRSPLRKAGTRLHWWLLEKFAEKPRGVQSNSFRIMKRFIRDAYVNTKGPMSSYGLMFHCTSHVSNVTVEHRPRAVGRSGFTLGRLIGSTMTSALTFSPLPLRMAAFFGCLLFIISIIGMAVAAIIHRFYIGLFWGFGLLCSFQLIALGILGEYIRRVFVATERAPSFSVRNVYSYDERHR